MSEKSIVSDFPKYLPCNPLFTGMPDYLKKPENFEKVYKTIYEAGVSKCNHSEVLEYATCFKCQIKMKERSGVMKKLGFSSGKQYLEWLKVHSKMREIQKINGSQKGEYYNT